MKGKFFKKIGVLLATVITSFSLSACDVLKETLGGFFDGSSSTLDGSASVSESSVVEDSSSNESSESSVVEDSSSNESSESSVVEDSSSNENSESSGADENVSSDDIEVHFLELGNKYTGDCTLIKVGDTEVLIDAGSRKGSAATINAYLEEYCTDGKLEYVIATHAHQDHIAGFVGTKKGDSRNGVFYTQNIGTLIQFSLTNATTDLYNEYCAAVDYLEEKGTNVYTATECWKGENGAARTYTLGEGVALEILYQRFYEEKTSDENDYSVCTLLTQGNNHYLFTGDLEHEGEASLVEENDLPKCKLYKGGHHGSPTSSTAALLAEIQPEIVCVCCCCGSDEYTKNVANMFPSQAFVDRIAPYTDRVYVTTIVADNSAGFTSMNGNIVVACVDGEITVRCSNNDTVFKDTQWFKDNREMPAAWLH